MKRKDFLIKTFHYSIGSCLGMHLLFNSKTLSATNTIEKPEGETGDDEFLKLFSWIKGVLNSDLTTYFNADTVEFAILTELKEEWGKQETVKLLTQLSGKYEDKAVETMGLFIKMTTIPYWTGRKKEAKKGSEVEDFIHVLWDPMGDDFKYEKATSNGIYKFKVTKCPFAKLAEKTNMHEWVYQMACITDYYMVPSFSKEIGFSRKTTLVQGDEYCDHTYYYKSKATRNDALLGYCGLYCGGCPCHQSAKNITPTNYKKENNYEVCEGCNSGFLASWCKECTIKECAKNKNVRICLDCDDYPCDTIIDFINDEKYPYHKEVEGKMKKYKELGLEKWLITQEKEYICKKCGTVFNFFEKKCKNCGSDL